MNIKQCPICGSTTFLYQEVLWLELINAWELNSEETEYINRQQGLYCDSCKNNLRAMALADAILSSYQCSSNLIEFSQSIFAKNIKILEINEAGALSPFLANFPKHQLITYPMYDMQQLDIASDEFNLVIHSDTLEHIPDPIKALSECCRVLVNQGRCIFTIPMVIARMSRSRLGLKNSYHGLPQNKSEDLLVHTEFGADAWCYVAKAGFKEIKIHSFEFPAAVAIEGICKK